MSERIKELGRVLWDSVIHFSATQESVTEMIRIAYEEGKAAQPEEAKDAERWRCLKRHHLQTGQDSWIRTGDDLEEAVDALLESDRRIAEGLDKLRTPPQQER